MEAEFGKEKNYSDCLPTTSKLAEPGKIVQDKTNDFIVYLSHLTVCSYPLEWQPTRHPHPSTHMLHDQSPYLLNPSLLPTSRYSHHQLLAGTIHCGVPVMDSRRGSEGYRVI